MSTLCESQMKQDENSACVHSCTVKVRKTINGQTPQGRYQKRGDEYSPADCTGD